MDDPAYQALLEAVAQAVLDALIVDRLGHKTLRGPTSHFLRGLHGPVQSWYVTPYLYTGLIPDTALELRLMLEGERLHVAVQLFTCIESALAGDCRTYQTKTIHEADFTLPTRITVACMLGAPTALEPVTHEIAAWLRPIRQAHNEDA